MKDGLHYRNDHQKKKQNHKHGIHINESESHKEFRQVQISDGDEGDGQEKHQKGSKEPQNGSKKLCGDEGAGLCGQCKHEISFVP